MPRWSLSFTGQTGSGAAGYGNFTGAANAFGTNVVVVTGSANAARGNPVQGAGINLTNIMPRIGLIYDFTGRGLSKVYGSYGRFYEYIPLDLADRSLSAEQQVALAKDLSNCSNPNDIRTCATIPTPSGQGRRSPSRVVRPRLPSIPTSRASTPRSTWAACSTRCTGTSRSAWTTRTSNWAA